MKRDRRLNNSPQDTTENEKYVFITLTNVSKRQERPLERPLNSGGVEYTRTVYRENLVLTHSEEEEVRVKGKEESQGR